MNTPCPTCKVDGKSEKVGWGYWYCHGCGDLWNTGTGNPVVLPTTEKKGKGSLQKHESVQSDVPELGKLTELRDTEIDFPL